MKLNKTLLPAITKIVGSVKDWEHLDIDGDSLTEAVGLLLSEMEPEKSEALIMEILELTTVDGHEVVQTFDLTFQGKYLTLIKVVAFSLEVNYKSFLPENGLQKLKVMAKKQSVSLNS
ncbi:MAG: hypothetical protein R3240_06515 [Gammaproteobacteria bacterium]|nr:hypothetical protein [Gammaproteobacteria bacterium]